ncbi:keratin, type I cytoskeletal 19-like [Hemicordylus capensis]|uniref:keratin, type I cytoskeletal 19-like n=1 Tax=Hemicordylus capensis TaxID=884348 RepID=UPI00230296C7|nr:keratin, type I cytoskeletal 19-like [Hemicordylus capensis]
MSFTTKQSTTTVYATKGRSSSGSCATGGGSIRVAPGVSGRCSSSAAGSVRCGIPGRSFSSGVSYGGGLGGGSCIDGSFGGGLGGGALGGGFGCAPGGGFSGGSVRFGHIGGGLGGGFGIFNEAPLISCDEKMTMQNLNDRLASYLDKVRCLEEENSELECKIKEWYDRQGPICDPKDYGCYYQQIEDLKNQIICATVDNSKLVLDIDNNRMTADDFRLKYETELALCQNVEADINGLRQVLDQLTLCRSDLEAQLESLREELCCLKKNHEEEVKCLKNQTTGDVSVEVNSCPGPDLKKVLEEMRCQYESMIENNRREVEQWYECKMEEVNREVCSSSKEVEDCNNQIVDLKRQLQTFEIDLQAQLSLRDTLQVSLAETECRYNSHLAEIQNQISCVEQQLSELRMEMECQNREYTELLDIKCRLEKEIQTYRCLLEGGHQDISGQSCGSSGGGACRQAGGNVIRTSHTFTTSSSQCQPCQSTPDVKGYSR